MVEYRVNIYVTEVNDYILNVEAADDSDAAYVATNTPPEKWTWLDFIDATGEHELESLPEESV
jgi:hypothetical protein